jgi:hypothetical protein
MRRNLLFSALVFASLAIAQTTQNPSTNSAINNFDADKALLEAKARGLDPVDYQGYVELKHREWKKENGLLTETNTNSGFKFVAGNSVSAATNIDFETGNYNGWSLYSGDNTVNSNGPLQNIQPMTAGPNDSIYGSFNNNCGNFIGTPSRQGLISTAVSTDPFCGIPLTSPMGGNYVARVNRYCANYEAAVLEQTFSVSGSQTWLNYAYAVILEDGGHGVGEQTYFRADVLDALGNPIPCCQVYMQAANGATPGFYPVSGSFSSYYKPWTPVSIDLSAYLGQNVTLRFTASGCIFAGHSGYAYVDARMDSVSAPGSVWPGDCNYDLTADVNDLFYIGWGYGLTGPVRAGATTNWLPQAMANWGSSGPYGVDYKHADSNGDGVIDVNDTLALSLNYNQAHPWKLAPVTPEIQGIRTLSMSANPSSVSPNQSFDLAVDLSSSGTIAADTLYGITFRLHVPTAFIAGMNSVDYANSFLGINNSSMLTLAKAFVGSGYIDLALVRSTHTNVTGSGNLLNLSLQSSGFASGGTGTFSLSNIRAIGTGGASLPYGSTNLGVNFNATGSGISVPTCNSVKLMPVPADETIFIEGLKGNNVNYEIINLLGETVAASSINVKSPLNISSLKKGSYFLRLYTPDGIVVKKFVKE